MRNNAPAILLAGALLGALAAPAAAQVSTQGDASVIAPAQKRSARNAAGSRTDPAAAAKQIVASTNAFRRSENLAAVEPNAQLLKAARYFADFMARTDKYGHNADGSAPAERARKFGYDYCIVSENIAYQYSSAGFSTGQLAQRFFEGWQNSPGHRKNMLDPNVTETAVAIAQSANTAHYYAVQMFGRPKSATIQFSVNNSAGVAVDYAVNDQTFPLPPRVTRTHQLCRPSVVTFQGRTVEPRSGQSLAITSDGGTLQLQTK